MPHLIRTVPNCGRSRRRGDVLERALYEATLEELAEVGYGGLAMERIATRAQTGKQTLYRRWVNKRDLVHDALLFAVPPLPEPRSGRSPRTTLLATFTAHRDMLAGKTAFPSLKTMTQLLHEPEIRTVFADAVVSPRLEIVESILQDAVDVGEVDPGTVTPLTARIGPALINHHFLVTGEPPNRRELALVVDTVIPPGRMKAEETRRLKELERENQRLKKLVAEQALDIDMLKEISRGNC